MKINVEHIHNSQEILILYSSLFDDAEAIIIIAALKEYICKSKIPFKERMLTGRIVESIETARKNPAEIRTKDLQYWLETKLKQINMLQNMR